MFPPIHLLVLLTVLKKKKKKKPLEQINKYKTQHPRLWNAMKCRFWVLFKHQNPIRLSTSNSLNAWRWCEVAKNNNDKTQQPTNQPANQRNKHNNNNNNKRQQNKANKQKPPHQAVLCWPLQPLIRHFNNYHSIELSRVCCPASLLLCFPSTLSQSSGSTSQSRSLICRLTNPDRQQFECWSSMALRFKIHLNVW